MRASNNFVTDIIHNFHNKNSLLAPFLVFRGHNLSAVNYQNPGKTLRKNKGCFMQTLHYKHHIMGIKLWELYYGYYDWMAFIIVIPLEEINATCKPIFF